MHGINLHSKLNLKEWKIILKHQSYNEFSNFIIIQRPIFNIFFKKFYCSDLEKEKKVD